MEIRGNGSITQLDKSKTRYKCRKWKLQVVTNEGRKSKRFTGAWSEAKIALDNFVTELENDSLSTCIKFRDFSCYWLESRKSTKSFSSNTISSNERNVRKLNKLFGKNYLSEISAKDIEKRLFTLKNEKTGDDVSNQHKAKLLTTLNQILQFAVRDKVIFENPCKMVQKIKKDKPKKKALSKKEFNETLNCLKNENMDGRRVALSIILYLGLRRSEVCALKWSDYDKQNKTLTVKRAFKDGDCTVGETKSNAGKRILPIPEPLCHILDEWKQIYEYVPQDDDYICINYYGDILRGVVLYTYWKKLTEKYNLHFVTLHELRHTNLTIVARCMSPFDLQKYAGWSDLSPARIYIHEDQSAMREAIDKAGF